MDSTENNEANRQDIATIQRLQKRIDVAAEKMAKWHKLYGTWRKAVTLEDVARADDDVKPHLIQSTLAALIPALYAKNPEIEIRPTAVAMQSAQAQVWAQQAATAEALIQQEFIDKCNLKRRAKSWLRACLTTGHGWLMVTWQDDFKHDPIQINRINDAQDNVARIKEIDRELNENEGVEEQLRGELAYQTQHIDAALNGQRELYIQQGLVIDRIASEDIFILDNSVTEMGDYLQANAIARRVHMTRHDYQTKFNRVVPESATNYRNCQELSRTENKSDGDTVRVYEVWDKSCGMVFTFVDGAKEWTTQPWAPYPTGERFYPFFEIDFNPVDGEFHPVSDVQLLIDLQNEYHMMRTQENHARKKNKPLYGVSKQGDLSAADANKVVQHINTGSDDAEFFAIDVPANQPISNAIQQFPPPQYNAGLWDPAKNARDVEMLTRSGDASRGFVNKAKTATEAEIMSMGMQSGISERQDIIEETMADMARYALQILLQVMTPEMVANALGGEHEWQNVNIDVAFQNLNLDIKAGSMSKPNKFQEREQWMQLMPMIQQTLMQIAQLQAQNMGQVAQAMRKMLEELINRFDERIDLDEFLPDVTPNPMQQMMQQMQGQQAAPAMPPELMAAAEQQPTGVMQ